MIWFQNYSIEQVNGILAQYMTGLLEIKATAIDRQSITATMPVNDKTRQPFGILHGGASVVLAESIGSIASNLILNPDTHKGVGLEINANHLRPVAKGLVTAVCSAIHIGKQTHIWDIRISDDLGNLNCISRLTVAIIPK
ncbi:esterase [Sphingobacterium sp. ML3W]|uniref:hotdog fold thioesterase n=1 Tax=Sphingobacterium TaxID=28453 RepID=UPI0004F92D41|nr:hotdog fold thioesterase [Sphingobacterium sp. ML3W]AIM38880.1 esterase [Sphingobacterium sp. ML3W]